MESIPFLTINHETLSLSQSLEYLRTSGLFPQVVAAIVRQHVLRTEFQSREDLPIDSLMVEQWIIDFRLQNQLFDPNRFQQWLADNGMTFETFHEEVRFRVKVEKLKSEIAAPKLQEYFEQNKPFFDRVVLSRIILNNKQQAENIKQQILEAPAKFEQLAREHSLTDDRVLNGMMGPVGFGQMPELLKTAVDLANPGELIGPIEIEGRYCVFRVEQFLPASLDNALKQELENQLFEQWIQEKLQGMNVKLEM